MKSAADLSQLYQLIAQQKRPKLKSGEHRGILGCGYVGQAVAEAWSEQGHQLTGTTTSPERLPELADIVDTPLIFEAGSPRSELSFIDDLDGLLISFAPSKSHYVDLDQYRDTFLGGLTQLSERLSQRRSSSPLQVVYLSSCGVYGDRNGMETHEDAPLDRKNPINQVLVQAEDQIRSVQSDSIKVCILRLGGIYGPGRDIAAMLKSAAGQVIPRNGSTVPCWIHKDDIVRGINLAFDQGLNDTYNLVDDLRISGRELTDRLCDQAGLPLVLWQPRQVPSRVLNARVSNNKLRQMGFTLKHSSMLS